VQHVANGVMADLLVTRDASGLFSTYVNGHLGFQFMDTNGGWWPSLVATAAEDRLSFRRNLYNVVCGNQRLPNNRDL
jgi:hypothetical protein